LRTLPRYGLVYLPNVGEFTYIWTGGDYADKECAMILRPNAASYPPPPSRFKSTTYVSSLSACVAGLVFGGLGLSSAIAQFLPPPLPSTVNEWKGPNGGTWETPGNWTGGLAPTGADDVLFGYEPVGGVVPSPTDESIRQIVDAGSADRELRSLWFKAGLWYTLSGTGELTLGKGGQETNVLVVTPGDAGEQSEHTIEGFSRFSVSLDFSQQQTVKIENYSEGGLGIFTDKIRPNERVIQIGGTGATHFAGVLGGTDNPDDRGGRINVGLDGGTGDQPQPHFILSGKNTHYRGELRVNYRGFAIIKADQALGGVQGERTVYAGGSLALRSHVETPLIYNVLNNTVLEIKTKKIDDTDPNEGIVRNEGTRRIGALYNDGGENHFAVRVSFSGDTLFGSRGDRKGGLFLTNQVSGTARQFWPTAPTIGATVRLCGREFCA